MRLSYGLTDATGRQRNALIAEGDAILEGEVIHGDEVHVLPSGLQIRAKSLEPIGIHDGSECWGIIVPDFRDAIARGSNEVRPQNLLISPIHPDSWPFVFHLQLAIADEVGALAAVTKALAGLGVNILLSECAPSGYHHATCNIIGEAVEVRTAFAQRLRDGSAIARDPWKRSTQTLCKDLAARMLCFIVRLREGIDLAHAGERSVKQLDQWVRHATKLRLRQVRHVGQIPRSAKPPVAWDSGFLSHRIFRHIGLLYDPAWLPDEEPRASKVERRVLRAARAEADSQVVQAVRCRWLENMAFCGIYGEKERMMRFRYGYDRRLLAPKGEMAERVYEDLATGYHAPTVAVASFDHLEHHVRLTLLHQDLVRTRLAGIDVQYRARAGAAVSSKGLLNDLCQRIRGEEINLRRISNKIDTLEPNLEKGSIRFLAELPARAESRSSPDDVSDRLEISLKQAHSSDGSVEVEWAHVFRYPLRRFFLSMAGGEKTESWADEIDELARDLGVEIVNVRDVHATEFMPKIREKLPTCQGIIQVAWKDGDVVPGERFLQFEHGLACGHGLPLVRVADSGGFCDHEEATNFWKSAFRTDPGKDAILRDFRTSRKEGFRLALNKLLAEIEASNAEAGAVGSRRA